MLKTFLDRGVGDTRLERLTSKGVARHVRGQVLLDARLACEILKVKIYVPYLLDACQSVGQVAVERTKTQCSPILGSCLKPPPSIASEQIDYPVDYCGYH
jgi:hypothetical protein